MAFWSIQERINSVQLNQILQLNIFCNYILWYNSSKSAQRRSFVCTPNCRIPDHSINFWIVFCRVNMKLLFPSMEHVFAVVLTKVKSVKSYFLWHHRAPLQTETHIHVGAVEKNRKTSRWTRLSYIFNFYVILRTFSLRFK